MFPTKFVPVVALLWLSMSNFHFEASGDVIPSPTANCEYPSCQQISPPSSSEYPSYGTPPPPPPPYPSPSGYSIYDAPPPPKDKGHSKCPPAAGAGVECCTPPVPYIYAPPVPYIYAPPIPYTYVPYGEGQGSPSTLLPVLVPLMMLFSSFIFLF